MTHQPPQPPAPPAPSAGYTPAWMFYVYHGIAYVTYNGRLIAQAAATTPAQTARIERLFHRLRQHAARRSAPAARLSLDRR